MPCPFRPGKCSKKGGVCSLRCYTDEDGSVSPVPGTLVATCPNRFYEDDIVFKWAAETLIHCSKPEILTELPFLVAPGESSAANTAVGRIDMVLLDPSVNSPMNWCALEMQAVYFSGGSITSELKDLQKYSGEGTPFPKGQRRPDFRSSGPKRLMPQLQIKVPTITRWGKKTAVVIDRCFWDSMGEMSTVQNVSNCDIAWFVVDFRENGGRFQACKHGVYLTTLDRAVEGLTAGVPTSLQQFEAELKERIKG